MQNNQSFSAIPYQYAATSFGNIAYREAGSGPAALFVHGVLLNGHLWDPLIERLAGVRRCIAIDILAHGASRAGIDQDLSFDTQAAMLAAFCAALNLDQVDVVANDSGGGIAQIFAARHRNMIRSLVLTDCDTHDNWPPKQAVPLHRLAKQGGVGPLGRRMLEDVAFARASFSAGFEHPDRLEAADFRTWLAPLFEDEASTRNLERFIASFDNRQTVAVAPSLRQLQAPTLIVWGTSDDFFPVKWAYWLRGAIPGAREVIELEGAKLFFPWERSEEFAGALRNFWR
ncbi:alpha/beta fold hydrolase [Bradyrhizobium sp.]|uniref:alpha/beta fold hydrolase n=1 Tax=Bradyrhizobium sp. TaxID=376 RepID=UPI003C3D8C4C